MGLKDLFYDDDLVRINEMEVKEDKKVHFVQSPGEPWCSLCLCGERKVPKELYV